MSCYSDNGIDQMLLNAFPPTSFGYACEVGANTGTAGSNTLALEQQGWLVLCIEPNPMLEPEGRAARKLWRQVACGAEESDYSMFTVVGSHPYAGYSGLELRYGGSGTSITVSVKVRTLDRLLEEAGFPCLDVLTIDAEGYEDEVLKGFSVERWKPQFIVVEDCDGSSALTKYQIPEGYEEMPRCHFDRVWRRNV
jgi:FkbM family methyltransferase